MNMDFGGSADKELLESPSGALLGDEDDLALQDLVGMLGFSSNAMGQGFDDLLLPCVPHKNEEGFFKSELLSDSDSGGMHGRVPMSAAQQQAGNMSMDMSDGAGGEEGAGKRRRRIRNAKQQELNRLAQQRYRLRKKQKYGDLQSAVDELASKAEVIAQLEGETGQLRKSNLEAQAKLQQQQKLLEDQKRRLETLPAVMMRAAAAAAAAARLQRPPLLPMPPLLTQAGRFGGLPGPSASSLSLPAQLLTLQGQQACSISALLSPTAPTPSVCVPQAASVASSSQADLSSSSAAPPAQQGELCDRLISALRAALSDVCKEQGWHESSAAQEQVLVRFGKSLNKELSSVQTGAAPGVGVTLPAPLMPGGPPPSAKCVPVTCC